MNLLESKAYIIVAVRQRPQPAELESVPVLMKTSRVLEHTAQTCTRYISGSWSGLRGSNPCPRLGKPLYYHCTKPA